MSHLKTLLFATVAILSSSNAFALVASPGPIVNDPNFNQTATTSPSYYGIAAWGASNPPGTNPTYAGSSGFGGNNPWDNGTPGNGQTKVGFIANSTASNPGFISQVISGFIVGDSYVITMLADGRVGGSTPAGLRITVAAPAFVDPGSLGALTLPATVYSNSSIAPVDLVGTSAAKFQTITSQAFTANASSLNVTLSNSGVQNSFVLISGLVLTDVTSVPEPVSLAVLGAGLLGLAAMRRRG